MENKKKLTKADLSKVTGGSRYYGNGVTCGKHKCTVNWGQAWTCGVNRLANFGHGNC